VLSGDVSPAHWPVDEAIEILSRDPLVCRTAVVLDAMPRGSAPSSEFPEGSPILPELPPGRP
jgi:hypothetical protein